jgi:hypothetical protein
VTPGQDYVVAVVVATEVPPPGTIPAFTDDMVVIALRAVCEVVRNRVAHPAFPDTAVQVVLAPKQFSAVCREDYWIRAMAGLWEPRHVQQALDTWQHHAPISLVPGALWYYSPASMSPPFSEPPWLVGKTEVLVEGLSRDYFRFYREVA